jgi:hypothetical protein
MLPRLFMIFVVLTLLLLLGVGTASNVADDVPDVDADVFGLPSSEIDFHVEAEMTFSGIKFNDASAYGTAKYCGFDASDQACTDCTNKPKW